uniref:Uncharacterized protein n=1 Tax=Lotharella vacuolata TaxID=74820 RepID=A0A0H5BJW0_9EUKA|nr:hypothetical protein [Lotharella vacuolata]
MKSYNRLDVSNCNYYYRILVHIKQYNINLYNFPLKIYTNKLETKLYSLLVNGEIIVWNLIKKINIIVIKTKSSITSFFFNSHDRIIFFISSKNNYFRFSINFLEKIYLKSKIINHIIIIFFFKKKEKILLISVDFYLYFCHIKNNTMVATEILRVSVSYKRYNFLAYDNDEFFYKKYYQKNKKKFTKKIINYNSFYINNQHWINNRFLLAKSDIILNNFRFTAFLKYDVYFGCDYNIEVKTKILTRKFKKFLMQLLWYLITKKSKKKMFLIYKPLITRHYLNLFVILSCSKTKAYKGKILKYFFEVFYKKLLYENLLLSSIIFLEIIIFFSKELTHKFNVFTKWSWGIFYILHRKWFCMEIFNNILKVLIYGN